MNFIKLHTLTSAKPIIFFGKFMSVLNRLTIFLDGVKHNLQTFPRPIIFKILIQYKYIYCHISIPFFHKIEHAHLLEKLTDLIIGKFNNVHYSTCKQTVLYCNIRKHISPLTSWKHCCLSASIITMLPQLSPYSFYMLG